MSSFPQTKGFSMVYMTWCSSQQVYVYRICIILFMQDISDVIVHIRDHTVHCISSPFLPFYLLCSSHCPFLSHIMVPTSTQAFWNITHLKTSFLLIHYQLQLLFHFSETLPRLSSILVSRIVCWFSLLPIFPSLPIDFCQIFSSTISLKRLSSKSPMMSTFTIPMAFNQSSSKWIS